MNSELLDDYLSAELSPRALATRHNISLEQLLDHFPGEPPLPLGEGGPPLAGRERDTSDARTEIAAESVSGDTSASRGIETLLARLEAFSLRRARVIGALMRPEVLRNLYETMHAAPVGTDTHRRAATTLLRAISPAPGGGDVAPRRDREGQISRGRGPQPPLPRHRMTEFLSDKAGERPAHNGSAPQVSDPDIAVDELTAVAQTSGAATACPVCGHRGRPSRSKRSMRTSFATDLTLSGAASAGPPPPPASGEAAQPPATDSQPSRLPDPAPDRAPSSHRNPTASDDTRHKPHDPGLKTQDLSACSAPLREKCSPDSRAPT